MKQDIKIEVVEGNNIIPSFSGIFEELKFILNCSYKRDCQNKFNHVISHFLHYDYIGFNLKFLVTESNINIPLILIPQDLLTLDEQKTQKEELRKYNLLRRLIKESSDYMRINNSFKIKRLIFDGIIIKIDHAIKSNESFYQSLNLDSNKVYAPISIDMAKYNHRVEIIKNLPFILSNGEIITQEQNKTIEENQRESKDLIFSSDDYNLLETLKEDREHFNFSHDINAKPKRTFRVKRKFRESVNQWDYRTVTV